MILVDTSVWVEHLRTSDNRLTAHLEALEVLAHPLVIGELAVGSIRGRDVVISLLRELPCAPVADGYEVLAFIEARSLHGLGLSVVDVHLLASTLLLPGATLWTRDSRLQSAAEGLGIATRS